MQFLDSAHRNTLLKATTSAGSIPDAQASLAHRYAHHDSSVTGGSWHTLYALRAMQSDQEVNAKQCAPEFTNLVH